MNNQFDNILNMFMLFEQNELMVKRFNSELTHLQKFDVGKVYYIKPNDCLDYDLSELSLIQYFLYMSWVQLSDLKTIGQQQVPHFVLYQNDSQVFSKIQGKMIDNQLCLNVPFMYADIITFCMWIGCSIRTFDTKEQFETFVFQSKTEKEMHQIPYVSVIGINLIKINLGSRRQAIYTTEQTLCFREQLVKDSNYLQTERIKHANLIASFRLKDFKINKMNEELIIPLSLSLVPLFHNALNEPFNVQNIQQYFVHFQNKFEFQVKQHCEQYLKEKIIVKPVFQFMTYFNNNDCPFHFYNLLLKLEQDFISAVFGKYLYSKGRQLQQQSLIVNEQMITVYDSKTFVSGNLIQDSCAEAWLTLLNAVGISEQQSQYCEMDEQTFQILFQKQPFLKLFDNEASMVKFKDTIAAIESSCQFAKATTDADLNNLFEKIFSIIQEKTCFFNVLNNIKKIFNQLAQLSFLCQNNQIFQFVSTSEKKNYFICDGSRSGKSSIVQAFFYYTVFQKMQVSKDKKALCITIVPQNSFQTGVQPLYAKYPVVLLERIDFFQTSRYQFERFQKQSFATLFSQLSGYIYFILKLCLANQVDHIVLKWQWQNIGNQVKSGIQKIIYEIQNPSLQFQEILTYLDLNIRSNFINEPNVLPSFTENIVSVFKSQLFEYELNDTRGKYDHRFLEDNVDLILCFDEFLSSLSNRLQDSPTILNFIPMLKLFNSLSPEQQQQIFCDQRERIMIETVDFFDQNEDTYLLKCAITNKEILKAQFPYQNNVQQLEQFRVYKGQIDLLDSKYVDIFFQKIYNCDDIIQLLLAGAPNICSYSEKVEIYKQLIYSSNPNYLYDQQINCITTDILFDLFSYRGAFITQFREIKAVINIKIRNITSQQKELDELILNQFVVSSVLRSKLSYLQSFTGTQTTPRPNQLQLNPFNFQKASFQQFLRCFNQQLQYKTCSKQFKEQLSLLMSDLELIIWETSSYRYFGVETNQWKMIQVNTDNSVINFLSLQQLSSQSFSSRKNPQNKQIPEQLSDKSAMLQKLGPVPSAHTKQVVQGLDILVEDEQELHSVYETMQQKVQQIVADNYFFIIEVALMFLDNIHLFQQLFASLNPHILIVIKNFLRQSGYFEETMGSNIINNMITTYYCNGFPFVNRFQPFLFHQSFQIQVDSAKQIKTKQQQKAMNLLESPECLSYGFVQCQIIQNSVTNTKTLFNGKLQSLHAFISKDQAKNKIEQVLKERIKTSEQEPLQLAFIRIIEASNLNLAIQQLIQNAFNSQLLYHDSSMMKLCFKSSDVFLQESPIFKFVQKQGREAIQDYQQKIIKCEQQLSKDSMKNFMYGDLVEVQSELFHPKIYCVVKRFYDMIENSYNLVDLNSTFEQFNVLLLKHLILSSNNSKENQVVFKVLRDLTLIIKLACILFESKNTDYQNYVAFMNQNKGNKISLGFASTFVYMLNQLEPNQDEVHVYQSLNSQNFYIDCEGLYLNSTRCCCKKGELKNAKSKQLSESKDIVIHQQYDLLQIIEKLCLIQDDKQRQQVVFAQLPLDQIYQSPDLLTEDKAKNQQLIKEAKLETMKRKAVNYFNSQQENQGKLFIIYFSNEMSAVEKTDLLPDQISHGHGFLMFVNLGYENFTIEFRNQLKKLCKLFELTQFLGVLMGFIGFEVGLHNLFQICQKFFCNGKIHNAFQLGVQVNCQYQYNDFNKSIMRSSILYQEVELATLINLVMNASKRYTFFRELLWAINNKIPYQLSQPDSAALLYQEITYHFKKYLK